MNRKRITNGVFFLLLVALAAFSVSALQTKEPYLELSRRAAEAMKRADYSAAVELYTEAINLFPKVDAYTPKNKKLKLSDGKTLETLYTGLEALYWSRAGAHLMKGSRNEADIDYANAMTVIKYEISKNIDKAKSLRRNADIKKERENGHSDIFNSSLARSAFDFGIALQACDKAKYLNQKRENFYRELKIPLPPAEKDIKGFDEVLKYQEEAYFGKAEAQATLMIEVENRAFAFWALKSTNELIAAFPNNVEAYRLRARVNRHWGRDAAAQADEEKAGELSAPK